MKPLQQFFQKKLQFLQSLRKRYIRQFVCYQAKQWTSRTKILVLPDYLLVLVSTYYIKGL